MYSIISMYCDCCTTFSLNLDKYRFIRMICLFITLPGQCSCLVSRPHIQNENVLPWSTKEICKREKQKHSVKQEYRDPQNHTGKVAEHTVPYNSIVFIQHIRILVRMVGFK